MSQFARASAVIALTPSADQREKKGYLVAIASDTATIISSSTTTVAAKGVILDGENTDGKSSVAILGCTPPVKMKAGGSITKGDYVSQNTDGSVITDPGTGSRVTVGIALEDAVSGELFEVAPLVPIAKP